MRDRADRLLREEAARLSAAELKERFPMGSADPAKWSDPAELAPAFAWIGTRPTRPVPAHTGLRFDAGTLAKTIERDGYDFVFAPEKATLYVQEMEGRLAGRV